MYSNKIMKTDMERCMEVLQNAVKECESEWIALSGGLDSSILAHLRKDQKPHAITIITKDFLGTDLTFSQIISKHTGLHLSLIQVTMEEILDSISETVEILDESFSSEEAVEHAIFLKRVVDLLERYAE